MELSKTRITYAVHFSIKDVQFLVQYLKNNTNKEVNAFQKIK